MTFHSNLSVSKVWRIRYKYQDLSDHAIAERLSLTVGEVKEVRCFAIYPDVTEDFFERQNHHATEYP